MPPMFDPAPMRWPIGSGSSCLLSGRTWGPGPIATRLGFGFSWTVRLRPPPWPLRTLPRRWEAFRSDQARRHGEYTKIQEGLQSLLLNPTSATPDPAEDGPGASSRSTAVPNPLRYFSYSLPVFPWPVPNVSRRYRQYVGLTLVIVVFVGGIIGWTYATLQVDSSSPAPADTTGSPPTAVEVLEEPALTGPFSSASLSSR